MKIKKDDEVKILLGKDRNKSGKVLRVYTKEDKVLVEGINMYKRHVRKMGEHEGGIVEISKPVNISNVVLVCPNCKKPTRVGFKIEGETKQSFSANKIRICKKCKEAINGKTKG